jgi:mannose-6-phosphate isomerase-like protein (cupin superfamily)
VAGHTVQQLTEVENQGVRFGIDERDYEIRMARVPLNCEHCGVTYMRLAPGFRQPGGHRHNRQEEIYILVNGSARMKVDDEVIEMKPWTAVRVPPEAMRQKEAGPEGAELVVVGAPNTGPGDAESTPGWWSD